MIVYKYVNVFYWKGRIKYMILSNFEWWSMYVCKMFIDRLIRYVIVFKFYLVFI